MSAGKTVNVVELLSVCIDLSKRAGDYIRAVAAGGDLKTVAKDWGTCELGSYVCWRSPKTFTALSCALSLASC